MMLQNNLSLDVLYFHGLSNQAPEITGSGEKYPSKFIFNRTRVVLILNHESLTEMEYKHSANSGESANREATLQEESHLLWEALSPVRSPLLITSLSLLTTLYTMENYECMYIVSCSTRVSSTQPSGP